MSETLGVDVRLSAPEVLALSEGETQTGPHGETERDAVLLECCDLPDKGLTLSEGDLDGIVSRFEAPVPLKLEHIDTPLGDLGTVKRIWRDGKRLLGKVSLPVDMAGLVRARGCKGLSCGLSRAPLALAELSLVLKPRVAAAVLLSEDDQAELVRLRAEVISQRVDAQVVGLKRAGKIVPATEAAARVLLSAGASATVTLSDGGAQGVAEAFAAYLDAQPAVVVLSEVAPPPQSWGAGGFGEEADEITLDASQRAFLEKSLGVKPEDVMATLRGK